MFLRDSIVFFLVGSAASAGASELVEAARSGNVDMVRRLLDGSADVNLAEPATKLNFKLVENAPGKGSISALVLLTLLRPEYTTPLWVMGWKTQKAQAVFEEAPNGMDALAAAVLNGHGEVVRLLLEKGASPNRRVVWKSASPEKATNLDVVIPRHREATPLILAAARNNRAIAEMLLAKGADPKAVDELGITAASFLELKTEDTGRPARILFYRPGRTYGKAIEPLLLIDGVPVANLDNDRHFSVTVNPGGHSIVITHWNQEPQFDHLSVKGGQTTSVRLRLEMRRRTSVTTRTVIPEDEARAEIGAKKMKPLEDKKLMRSEVDYWSR